MSRVVRQAGKNSEDPRLPTVKKNNQHATHKQHLLIVGICSLLVVRVSCLPFSPLLLVFLFSLDLLFCLWSTLWHCLVCSRPRLVCLGVCTIWSPLLFVIHLVALFRFPPCPVPLHWDLSSLCCLLKCQCFCICVFFDGVECENVR